MAQGDVTASITSNNGKGSAVFDGINDRLTGQVLNLVNHDFSMSGWFWIEGSVNMQLLNNAKNTNARCCVSYNAAAGDVRGGYYDGTAVRATADSNIIDLKEWVHVTYTYEHKTGGVASVGKIYINGIDDTEGNGSPGTTAGENLYFGSRGAADYLKGAIAEVRIYEKTLTPSEVLKNYRGEIIEDRLIADYPMNDYTDKITGTTATNNGTYISARDDAIASQIKSQRVTAGDKFLCAGIMGGQVVSVAVEE